MNILILHRIPYHKVNYHLSINHGLHDVTYIGLAEHLMNVPPHIKFRSVARPGKASLVEEVVSLVEARELKFDLLIAQSEFDLLDAARIREMLGIPGPTINETRKLQDRALTRRLIEQSGILVSRSLPLQRLLRDSKIPWHGKTVLRPVDRTATTELKTFNTPVELIGAVKAHQTGIERLDAEVEADQIRDQFEVEELIEGKIMHFDGIISAGRVVMVIGSIFVGDFMSYAKGNPLGSVQVDLSNVDQQWIQRVIDAIGIRQGMFHMVAINTGTTKVFLDFANRAAGANVVETFRMATGVNLIAAQLMAQVGEKITFRVRKKPKKFGWFVFPGHHLPAGCCRISGHTNYVDHPMMIRCEMLNKRTPLPRHITYRPSSVPMAGIVAGSSSDEMVNWIKRLFRDVEIRSPETSKQFS